MKRVVCRVMLYFLFRGMRILKPRDEKVRACFRMVPVGVSLRIVAGMEPNAPSVTLVNGRTKILRGSDPECSPDVTVTFKSLNFAHQVLTGGMSISDAYARHTIFLRGNLNEAMAFFRAMEYVQAYLLPERMAKRIVKRMPKKMMSTPGVYVRMIFSN